jgi:hypothetical protein
MPIYPDKIGQWAAILGASLLLHACASDTSVPPTSLPKPSRKPAPPLLRPSAALPAPRIQPSPGLEGVIGTTAAEIIRQFGPPRLDVSEGDARKLQFTGIACVLDIYLYPAATGKPPLASFIAARRSDGRDVDRVACVMALRKK